ncbi:DUF1802 family protein [Spirulina sp. CS-785/01]|uniref:DUF1802 family protein n=1 Tax=Spirulina sp. CS-785/01 TaxID=3021716 RepID=UPI00232F9FF7|nr:DUF1802 family protein [Spirulina sp. CS-785/01]MDB9314077.1 DUF1802 family protein [Spirulina sp. CS-785/01]
MQNEIYQGRFDELKNALYLPRENIQALLSKKMIVVIPLRFIHPGRSFILYPVELDSVEQTYKPSFLETLTQNQTASNSENVIIQTWAKCEKCEIEENADNLNSISQLTVWQTDYLQQLLKKKSRLFLAYLRVYQLDSPQAMPITPNAARKLGKITGIAPPLTVSQSQPVFDETAFNNACEQLEKRQLTSPKPDVTPPKLEVPPPKPEVPPPKLEINVPEVSPQPPSTTSPLDWIEQLTIIGNSKQGHEFERLVRQSLIFLGFGSTGQNPKASLDPTATGGPGGLDFYATTPYPVVGECKATQTEKVPDGTPAQLVKLGHKILQAEYDTCIKILAVAGELTNDAQQTAMGNNMNVVRPETLQRLVRLKAAYGGAINLWELKRVLETPPFGQEADGKIKGYIEQVWDELRVRSHVIQVLQQYLHNTHLPEVSVDQLFGAYMGSPHPQPLNLLRLHEILIELSSPLTGYLGRIRGETWKEDRFYVLQELNLNDPAGAF